MFPPASTIIVGQSPIKVSKISVSPSKKSNAPTVENYNRVFDENLNKKTAAGNATTKSRILEWIIFLLPVVLAIMCIFGAAFLIHQNLQDHHAVHSAERVLTNVNTNLKTQPIEQILQVEQKETCPAGFNTQVLGFWPGVKPGCLCEDKSEHDRIYCVFHSSCKFVKEKDPIEESVWYGREGIFFQKDTKFCVKRTTSFSHQNKEGQCPAEHKTCFNGCVPNSGTCPLNVVAPTTVDQTRNVVSVTGRKLLFDQSALDPQNAIINLRLSSGTGKCYDPKTAPKFASTKFYPYQREPEKGCENNELQTTNFQNIDEGTEQEVFKINKVQPTVNELPFWDTYYNSQDKFNLLVERRITVANKDECQDINTKTEESMEEYARSTRNVLHGLAIAILVISCLIIVIAIIFFVLRRKIFVGNNNPVKVIYILGFILLILCIVLAIVYLCKRDKLQETSDIYQKYVDKQCFQEAPINKACTTISGYAKTVESNFAKYALYFFISSVAIMLLGLLLAVWRKGSQGERQLFEKPWDLE